MIRAGVRSLWAEPSLTEPAPAPWWDRLLVVATALFAVVEGMARTGLSWHPWSVLVPVALAAGFWWRRSHPFEVTVVALSTLIGLHLLAFALGGIYEGSVAMALVLLFPYSTVRWESGPRIVIGIGLLVTLYAVSLHGGQMETGGDAVGAGIALLLPVVTGAAVRFRAVARLRQLDQVRSAEREQLARELHDSVAHSISAIAIQAQVGRTRAGTDPGVVAASFETIEEIAGQALTDLRSMVGALRQRDPHGGGPAQLQPGATLADIGRLADDHLPGPRVDIELRGDLGGLGASLEAGLFRLAQESVTNARRHARRATVISVLVEGRADEVALTVDDDGDPVGASSRAAGFGLVGMGERVALLGGELVAGPGAERGWTVAVTLPRSGR